MIRWICEHPFGTLTSLKEPSDKGMISTSLVGGSRRRETKVVTLELEPETSWKPLVRSVGGSQRRSGPKPQRGSGRGHQEAAEHGGEKALCSPGRVPWPPRAARGPPIGPRGAGCEV